MFLIIKKDVALAKYNETSNKIKETLNTKFYNMSFYDKKYIKDKVRKFNGVIKTNFLGGEVPREGVHYNCIACTAIGSVMKIERKIIHTFI